MNPYLAQILVSLPSGVSEERDGSPYFLQSPILYFSLRSILIPQWLWPSGTEGRDRYLIVFDFEMELY